MAKFTCNTKPLADALALGIINTNVSSFHKKSTMAQLTADANTLKVNIEATSLCTEIRIKGSGEDIPAGSSVTVFVDSLLLKQLANTLESATVTLDFDDTGLIIRSGKSKMTLEKAFDPAEMDLGLKAPTIPDYNAPSLDVDKSDWKFIKDNQMYAIAMAFINPVYTRVWVGNDGDVIVGDFDNSLFTHSQKSKLGKQCLLSDTIINLFNALPEGAKLTPVGESYLLQLKNDSFEYITEFTPMYEDDENVGDYNSAIILGMMNHPDNYVKIATAPVHKALSQADLLSSNNEDTIKLSVSGKTLKLDNKNINSEFAVEVPGGAVEFEVDFKLDMIKNVLGHYSDEQINIAAMYQESTVTGIIVWNDSLTTIVAGVE